MSVRSFTFRIYSCSNSTITHAQNLRAKYFSQREFQPNFQFQLLLLETVITFIGRNIHTVNLFLLKRSALIQQYLYHQNEVYHVNNDAYIYIATLYIHQIFVVIFFHVVHQRFVVTFFSTTIICTYCLNNLFSYYST